MSFGSNMVDWARSFRKRLRKVRSPYFVHPAHDVDKFLPALFTMAISREAYEKKSFASKKDGLRMLVLKKALESSFTLFCVSRARPGRVLA